MNTAKKDYKDLLLPLKRALKAVIAIRGYDPDRPRSIKRAVERILVDENVKYPTFETMCNYYGVMLVVSTETAENDDRIQFENVGEFIRQKRVMQKMKQAWLAEQIGCTPPTLCAIEKKPNCQAKLSHILEALNELGYSISLIPESGDWNSYIMGRRDDCE